jgi:small ligand-binding sensory domain FIST
LAPITPIRRARDAEGDAMHWSSAVSDEPILEAAVAEVAAELLDELGEQPVDLAVAFVSHHFAARYAELPKLLRAGLPHRVLIGCSAGGVIGGGRELEGRAGLSVTAAHLPGVMISPFVLEARLLPNLDASPRAWHEALAVPAEPTPHFILLADPFSFPAPELLAGLDYAYPRSVKVGGLASGASGPGGNAIYAGATARRSGLAGVALSGDIAVDTIVAQGCRPIGKPLRITRCEANVLFELEGRSPIHVLSDLLDTLSDRDKKLISNALFLGISVDAELERAPRAGEFLIRNLMGIDPERGVIAVGEQLRNGQLVQFHLRDAESSASDLGALLDRFAGGGPAATARGALLFSCLGRGIHLYGAANHDTDAFKERVGDVPIGGFFCNGEIGPVGGVTHLHGYTSSFGIFGPARG